MKFFQQKLSPARRLLILVVVVFMIYALPRSAKRKLWNATFGRLFQPDRASAPEVQP